ncbi:hypothetical protein B0H34DRAFT_796197 [Crassisporium funariophilum]|nr:hypothetical protein B0H34DRAFT_796197 [Crassisporium funariophilum]
MMMKTPTPNLTGKRSLELLDKAQHIKSEVNGSDGAANDTLKIADAYLASYPEIQVEHDKADKGVGHLVRNYIATPPLEQEDDEHTLVAFGDISLNNICFIPGPPSALTPVRRTKKKTAKPFPVVQSRVAKFSSEPFLPAVIKNVLPPSPSKACVFPIDMDFETMVNNLKQTRERETVQSRSAKPTHEPLILHSPQPSHLIDLKRFGKDADMNVSSPDRKGAANPKELFGEIKADENAGSEPISIPRPKGKALRGNNKLPRRPPIPQWDLDYEFTSRKGRGELQYHLGPTTHRVNLT